MEQAKQYEIDQQAKNKLELSELVWHYNSTWCDKTKILYVGYELLRIRLWYKKVKNHVRLKHVRSNTMHT